jgi:single-strand DNA-binding protein
MNINDLKIIGNLTREPELRFTPKGTPVANVSLGVNENFTVDGEKKQVTTFIDAQVWGASAENLAKLASKGQELFVEGSLRQEQWEDKETGKNRYKLFLKADRWQFTQYRSKEAAREGMER